MGIRKIILKSDCLLMIQLCNLEGGMHPSSEVGVLAKEIHELVKAFDTCKLQHVYREFNIHVHLLECFAWHLDSCILWENNLGFVNLAVWLDAHCNSLV